MTDPQSTKAVLVGDPVPPEIAAAPRLPSGLGHSDGDEVTPAPADHLDPIHGEFAAFHQGYAWNAITLADSKATWAFTVCGGVLAYLVAQSPIRALLLAVHWPAVTYVSTVSLGLLTLATFCAFLVIVPRLGAAPNGLVYFGSVAKRSDATAFINDVSRTSAADLSRARLTHSYDLSRIADLKYRRLRLSMWSGLLGLACAAAAILLGATAELAPTRPPADLAPRDAPSASVVVTPTVAPPVAR